MDLPRLAGIEDGSRDTISHLNLNIELDKAVTGRDAGSEICHVKAAADLWRVVEEIVVLPQQRRYGCEFGGVRIDVAQDLCHVHRAEGGGGGAGGGG